MSQRPSSSFQPSTSPFPNERLQELLNEFVSYLHQRQARRSSPASASTPPQTTSSLLPYRPSSRALRALNLWTAFFLMNVDLVQKLVVVLTSYRPRSGRVQPHGQRQDGARDEEMRRMLQRLDGATDTYEDEELQAMARSVIPEEVFEKAKKMVVSAEQGHGESESQVENVRDDGSKVENVNENATTKTQQPTPPWIPFDSTDALAFHLLSWFKNDFMKWVDPVLCVVCGSSTEGIEMQSTSKHTDAQNKMKATPSDEDTAVSDAERRDGAGRVELYRCTRREEGGENRVCGAITRFPRYNDLCTLLRTRRGRCGEFSNLFQLFLRSVDIRARVVYNAEDHVWNEYWSTTAPISPSTPPAPTSGSTSLTSTSSTNLDVTHGHWVHLDPSEGAFAQPHLYCTGWGKKQSYCYAFGEEGAEDVSKVYIDDLGEGGEGWKRRKMWVEDALQQALNDITAQRRRHLHSSVLHQLEQNDASQSAWKVANQARIDATRLAKERLPGRVSGTDDWKAMRKEIGLDETTVGVMVMESSDERLVFSSTKSGSLNLRTYGSSSMSSSSSSSSPSSSEIILTPCQRSQAGAVWLTEPLNGEVPWESEIVFRMEGEEEGADGIAFVCQVNKEGKNRWIGRDGSCIGYDGLGDRGDWAVELDTHQTESDPPVPHISLHFPPRSHHQYALQTTPPGSIPDISNGQTYRLRIQYTTEGKKRVGVFLGVEADVKVDGKDEGDNGYQGWMKVLDVELPDMEDREGKNEILLGLTAATGGLCQGHIVSSWKVWQGK